MKIVGLCQFSVFGPPERGGPADGRLEVATLDEARARLWHPVRIAQRFHLLESLLLPAIRAQTDPEFEIFVTVSKDMPDLFQARLERVTKDIPGLRVLQLDGMAQDAALRAVMEEASGGFAEPVAYFQVGDDQALALDFIQRLQEASRRVDPGAMVSFPAGVLGFHDGTMVRHCMVQHVSGPIGLAGVMPPGPAEMTADLWLGRSIGRVPVFSDPRFAAYHRTLLATPADPTYRHLFPMPGVLRRLMIKTIGQHPELAAGAAVTHRAGLALAAFSQVTAAVFEAAMHPVGLAEAMGFPLEPR